MNSELAVASDDAASVGWFERIVAVSSCAVLFAPAAVMYFFYAPPEAATLDVSAETVGVAVILRATLRRLFRSGSRSVLQTAVGTVSRASARTMTRRVVRVGVKSLTGFLRRVPDYAAVEATADAPESRQSAPFATLVGFVALTLSLAGVLLLLDVDRGPGDESPSGMESVLQGLSWPVASLLGALPLPVYVALTLWAAPRCGAVVRYRTGWEALLLQAYFTGSGSYLPLSTDSEIEGTPQARARLAAVGLGGLFVLHWICWGGGAALGSYALQFVGGLFLLYCFVFSFPIAPLDGYHFWSLSWKLWLVIWIPILASFIWVLPEPLHVIL